MESLFELNKVRSTSLALPFLADFLAVFDFLYEVLEAFIGLDACDAKRLLSKRAGVFFSGETTYLSVCFDLRGETLPRP